MSGFSQHCAHPPPPPTQSTKPVPRRCLKKIAVDWGNEERMLCKTPFGIWLPNAEILSLSLLSPAGGITHRHKQFRQFPWGQWRAAPWWQLGMGHRLLMYFSYLLLPCWSQLFLRHSCQQTWGTERRLVLGVTMMPLIDAAPVTTVALGLIA